MYIAVIPARGGSKGIPQKNIVDCGGKPLIQWTIEACQKCEMISRVIVSTDSQEIAGISEGLRADVIKRPPSLATDNAPTIDVIKHVLELCNFPGGVDVKVVVAQATSPLRDQFHLAQAIEMFKLSNCRSLVSVQKVPHNFNPESLYQLSNNILQPLANEKVGTLNRHQKKTVYARNGAAIYISDQESIKDGILLPEPVLGYEMTKTESIDIDDHQDLFLADLILKHKVEGAP